MTQAELRQRQRALASRQQALAGVQTTVSRGVSVPSPSVSAPPSKSAVVVEVDPALLSSDDIRSFRSASRADIVRKLEAQIAEAQRQSGELFRAGKRRESRRAQEIVARTKGVLSQVRSGKGGLSSEQVVRIAQARFPKKRQSYLQGKFGFDEEARRARAGTREKESLTAARDAAGFEGSLKEFKDFVREEDKKALTEVAVSRREVFLATGQSVQASPEQVLEAQKELLRKGGAVVTVGGRRVGVVGDTLFFTQQPSKVAATGGDVSGSVGVSDFGESPRTVTSDIISALAVQPPKEPTTRVEKFERQVESIMRQQEEFEASPFFQGSVKFASKAADVLTGETRTRVSRGPVSINVVNAPSDAPPKSELEFFDFGQNQPTVTRQVVEGLLSPQLLVTDVGFGLAKAGLAFEAATIPETRGQVLPELFRAGKEVESREFSFLPGGTPITSEGKATLVVSLTAGLLGRGGRVTARQAAADAAGIAVESVFKTGEAVSILASNKKGGTPLSRSGVRGESKPRKRGTRDRKPKSLVERSKESRGLVSKKEDFNQFKDVEFEVLPVSVEGKRFVSIKGEAVKDPFLSEAQKRAVRYVQGRAVIDIGKGGSRIRGVGTPPKKAKVGKDVPYYEQFAREQPNPQRQRRKSREVQQATVLPGKTLSVPGGGKVQVFFKDAPGVLSQGALKARRAGLSPTGVKQSKRQKRRQRGKEKGVVPSGSGAEQLLLGVQKSKGVGKKQSRKARRESKRRGRSKQLGFVSGAGQRQAKFVPPPEFVEFRVDPVTGFRIERNVGGFRPGMRERLFSNLESQRAPRPKGASKPKRVEKPKGVVRAGRRSRVDVFSREGLGFSSRLKFGVGTGVGLSPALASGQAQAVAQAQDFDRALASDSVVDSVVVSDGSRVFDFDSPPRPSRSPPRRPPRRITREFLRPPRRTPPRRRPPRRPRVPTPKLPGFSVGKVGGFGGSAGLVDAFLVEIKRRGKFETLGTGLSRSEALRLGSQQTLSELAATFRVRRSGGRVRASRVGGVPDLRSFREFKIRKGERVATPGTFIQRRGKRLVTRREVNLLQRAKKNRRVSFL